MSVQIREKSYFREKFQVLSYRLLPYGMPENDNSESLIFFGIAKILIALWVLEETRQTWSIFSKLKALVDSEIGIFTFKHDPICDSKILSYHSWT